MVEWNSISCSCSPGTRLASLCGVGAQVQPPQVVHLGLAWHPDGEEQGKPRGCAHAHMHMCTGAHMHKRLRTYSCMGQSPRGKACVRTGRIQEPDSYTPSAHRPLLRVAPRAEWGEPIRIPEAGHLYHPSLKTSESVKALWPPATSLCKVFPETLAQTTVCDSSGRSSHGFRDEKENPEVEEEGPESSRR